MALQVGDGVFELIAEVENQQRIEGVDKSKRRIQPGRAFAGDRTQEIGPESTQSVALPRIVEGAANTSRARRLTAKDGAETDRGQAEKHGRFHHGVMSCADNPVTGFLSPRNDLAKERNISRLAVLEMDVMPHRQIGLGIENLINLRLEISRVPGVCMNFYFLLSAFCLHNQYSCSHVLSIVCS
jgi:hypothetical protein